MNTDAALYELALSRPVTKNEIVQAYRRMAKRFHPDKIDTTDEKAWAQGKFILVEEAYECLKNLPIEDINREAKSETICTHSKASNPGPAQDHVGHRSHEGANVGMGRTPSVDWPILLICLSAAAATGYATYVGTLRWSNMPEGEASGIAIGGGVLGFFLSAWLHANHECAKEDKKRSRENKMT